MTQSWITPLIGVVIGLIVVFVAARVITSRASKTASTVGTTRPGAAMFLVAPFPAWTSAMNALRAQDGLGRVRIASWTRAVLSVDAGQLEIHSHKGAVLLSRPASAVTGIDTGTIRAGLSNARVVNVHFGAIVLPLIVFDAAKPFTAPVTDTQKIGGLLAAALWPERRPES